MITSDFSLLYTSCSKHDLNTGYESLGDGWRNKGYYMYNNTWKLASGLIIKYTDVHKINNFTQCTPIKIYYDTK